MPLQNRVDPFSRIHAHPSHGSFMGNRGHLHDAATKTLIRQTWTTDTWIICLCTFKGRQRKLMAQGSYTELFFLDEATGLAAGHRPCYECRRQDAAAFAAAMGRHLKRADRLKAPEVAEMILSDIKPHLRRRKPQPRKMVKPECLPDGAMFAAENQAFLKLGSKAYQWTFEGYGQTIPLPRQGELLTPRATCNALANGYSAQIHPTASS